MFKGEKTQSIYVEKRKDNKAIRSRNINNCEKKAEKDKFKFPLLFHLLLISPFFKMWARGCMKQHKVLMLNTVKNQLYTHNYKTNLVMLKDRHLSGRAIYNPINGWFCSREVLEDFSHGPNWSQISSSCHSSRKQNWVMASSCQSNLILTL